MAVSELRNAVGQIIKAEAIRLCAVIVSGRKVKQEQQIAAEREGSTELADDGAPAYQ
jgi:hypothetical protein